MKKNKNIDNNELDQLLRDLYLDENSKKVNESEVDFVLSQHYNVKTDSAKEKELIARLQRRAGGGFDLYFPIICLLALIGFLAMWTFIHPDKISSDHSKQEEKNKTIITDNNKSADLTTQNITISDSLRSIIKNADTFGRPIILEPLIENTVINDNKEGTVQEEQKKTNTIPFLTENDKARYTKIKEQILAKLLKQDKGLYTHIDANKLSYANETVIVDAFTIRNVGISNLEYKTFLADLLIQKRNEDYLIANVSNEAWVKYNCTNLAISYFQDEKYNDFPVVNISLEAAKLFCKWLETETALFIQQHKLKIKPLQIRLPYDEEWIYAAREGYAKIAFEKGYNTIYDLSEGLVDKSFANRAELIKKRVKRVDTLYDKFVTNKYGWSEKEIIIFLNSGTGYYSSLKTDTIYADRMKVQGKLGRVSEMVFQKKSSRIWLSGLSWKSKEDYLKMENEFKANTYSPFVGFRPVIINLNDPEYKDPFW